MNEHNKIVRRRRREMEDSADETSRGNGAKRSTVRWIVAGALGLMERVAVCLVN